MKIVLINPPVDVETVYGKYSDMASFQPPVGLCALAGYLIKYGYKDVKIIDACVSGFSVSDIIKDLIYDSPDLVGIYCNTPNYYVVSKLVFELKKAKESQKIVLGGPHPTALPEDTLNETKADFCVIGEGEQTLLELIRHIDNRSNELDKIEGLAFKTFDNQVVMNKTRERISDLDSLPFPAIHLLPPLSRYKLYLLQYKRLPYMTIITSRGCPYNCVFCATPFGNKVRSHSPEYVVEYIDYLTKQFGVKELSFCDDTFTINENRIFNLCDLMQKRNLDVSWYAATRANIKDKRLFYLMKKAGCWICAIGVESGDPDILRLIGKNISLEQVKTTCRMVLKAGLKLKTFFIIGSPGETLETIDRTINFAKSLNAHFPVFSLMTPFPGTRLWDTAEEYGYFDRTNFQKLLISTSDPVFIPFGLTKEDLLQKQKEAFRKVYFNLGMAKRQVASIGSLDAAKNISKAIYIFLKLQLDRHRC